MNDGHWMMSCAICGGFDSNEGGQHNNSIHVLHGSVENLCEAIEALSMLAMVNEDDQKRVLEPVLKVRLALATISRSKVSSSPSEVVDNSSEPR